MTQGKARSRMRAAGVFLLASAFIGLAVYLPTVRLTHRGSLTGTTVVAAGDSVALEFNVTVPEVFYQFTVLSGPAIDVYVVQASDYARYKNGSMPLDGYQYDEVTRVQDSPYLGGNVYWAILDNTPLGVAQPTGESASVQYRIDADAAGRLDDGALWSSLMVTLGIAAVAAVGILLTFLDFPLRRRA